MKKLVTILSIFSLLLCLLLVPVSASDGLRIIDYAGLLTNGEAGDLQAAAEDLEDRFGLVTVVLTVNTLDGDHIQSYSDDFYDSMFPEDGVILVISMEEREWHIGTCGKANRIFSDWDLYEMEEAILPYLSQGDYYNAFQEFYSSVEYCCETYTGVRSDVNEERSIGSVILTSLLIGTAVAAIAIMVMRASMNTKRAQRSASDYLSQNAFQLNVHQDMFLYSQVSRTRRQQQSSGGSTTHMSSSGRSHGGRSGRF